MVNKRNHLLYHVSKTIHHLLACFYATKYFKKKEIGEMFIEQIIEFRLRGPGPPGHLYTLITDYFLGEIKISRKIFELIIS